MHMVVIGGTGHIGTYLVPRLVELGHAVTVVSRGRREPYTDHGAWASVTLVTVDRKAQEAAGTFGPFIADLEGDVVVDLICFTPDSARHLAQSLADRVQHLLHCGTIWVHGHSCVVPTTEDAPRRPFGDYGTRKAAIEAYLLGQAQTAGLPATVLHPGHISGPGWVPINPAGHLELEVFRRLATGQPVALPNLGMETLHHVHADDVAQAFVAAITHRAAAIGQAFHVVSPAALTLRGYAEAVASWYGQQANLEFLPLEQWAKTQDEQSAKITTDHITHSPNCSIEKARKRLGYDPQYSSLQTVREAIDWLERSGALQLA